MRYISGRSSSLRQMLIRLRYPGYRYQPVYRRTNVIRRRVRKDEAEEEKCHSVAQLLLAGKTGQKLETEIKAKIRRGPTAAVPRNREK